MKGGKKRDISNNVIYIPMLCSIIMVLHSIFDYYDIHSKIFSYIGGTSLIIWVYFLKIAYYYRTCIYQRMFIYYLIVGNCIAIYDTYIGIPISDIKYLLIFCITFGILVLLYGYFKYKENVKNKEKNSLLIDYEAEVLSIKCENCGRSYEHLMVFVPKSYLGKSLEEFKGLCSKCKKALDKTRGTGVVEIMDGILNDPKRTGKAKIVSK